MPQMKLTIEDVSFTADADLSSLEMTDEQTDEINAKAHADGFLQGGIEGVLGAHVAEDDNQDDEDLRKIFVSIDLLVSAEDADEAEAMEPPVDLLDLVAAAFLPQDVDAARENSWEVLSADSLDD